MIIELFQIENRIIISKRLKRNQKAQNICFLLLTTFVAAFQSPIDNPLGYLTTTPYQGELLAQHIVQLWNALQLCSLK